MAMLPHGHDASAWYYDFGESRNAMPAAVKWKHHGFTIFGNTLFEIAVFFENRKVVKP